MGKLIQDITRAADEVARALRSSNYRANFSPQSLWDIDLFFDDHSAEGAPKPRGLLAEKMGQRLFALGGYVGETIRRSLGGEWQADDADPRGEINIALKLPDGSLIWPVQRVMKRLKNGPEDGIAAYGLLLGLPVGQRPAPFSPFRGQGGPAVATRGTIPPEIFSEASEERKRTSRIKNFFGGFLLFLASMLGYVILIEIVTGAFVANIFPMEAFRLSRVFLFVIAMCCYAGAKLCDAPKQVAAKIWFCFCPLALFNSWYFHHLQNDPFFQASASRMLRVATMSTSSLIMAGITLIVGRILLWLDRAETVMSDEP